MPDDRFPVAVVGGVPVVAAPEDIDITNAEALRSALLTEAQSTRSAAIVDVGPGGSPLWDASRLEAAWLEFDAQVRRFEQAKARLQATVDQARARLQATVEQARNGRSRQEIWDASAYARLQARLETMPVIEQAKGILMAQQRCGPDEAFDLLRRASQRANIKVSVLAARIVEQVASPGPGVTHARPGRQREGQRRGSTEGPVGHTRHRVA